jgi:multidrug efflux pump subunit AcrA (membrane-fusion protein)
MASSQRAIGTSRAVGNSVIRNALPLVILVVSVIGFFLLSRFLKTDPVVEAPTVALPEVRVDLVHSQDGGMKIETDGVVVPYREVSIAAEVAGRIVEKSEVCQAGHFVTAGTPLVKIDPQDYLLEVERLEEEVQQADIMLDELKEELVGVLSLIELADQEVALRQRELKRQRSLSGVVTSSDMERAEANELAARSAAVTQRNRKRLLETSRSRLESARDLVKSKLRKAQLDLKRTQIVAPADGVVVSDAVEADGYVQKGTQLLVFEDTSKTEVKCKLEMEDLFWLWNRRAMSNSAPTLPTTGRAYEIPETPVRVVYRLAWRKDIEFVWEGTLSGYDGIGLDEKTRTVPCRIVVNEPQAQTKHRRGVSATDASVSLPGLSGPPALVRGMFVTVRLQLDPDVQLLRLPEETLRPGNTVWCVRDDRLLIVPVYFVSLETDYEQGTPRRFALIYVNDPSQLADGDKVVTSPLASVSHGMQVKITEDSSEPGEDTARQESEI